MLCARFAVFDGAVPREAGGRPGERGVARQDRGRAPGAGAPLPAVRAGDGRLLEGGPRRRREDRNTRLAPHGLQGRCRQRQGRNQNGPSE